MTFARSAAALAFVLVVCGCAPGRGSALGSAGSPRLDHVFVIVMENKTAAEALSMPYTASLAGRYATLTNYHAVASPSLPNYLALTSGQTWGIGDDAYHQLPKGGIGSELSRASVPWRAYMEGMSGDCLTDTSDYAVKHDPFAYYGGACPSNVVPLDRLASDLKVATPRFVWITPDLCHDTHDCPTEAGDRWLATMVPEILASAAWQHDGALFIVWDESDGSDSSNQVAAIVAAPNLRTHSSAVHYDHYSLLATIEDGMGLPRLGRASQARAISILGD